MRRKRGRSAPWWSSRSTRLPCPSATEQPHLPAFKATARQPQRPTAGFGPSTSATRGDPWVADVCCTGSLLLLLEPGRHDFLVRVHPFLGGGLGRHAALNVSGYGILVL